MKRIYCDISATTPIDMEVANLMHDLQKTIFGNPSSIHREGQAAKVLIEKARRQIATSLTCNPEEIIFTSSGTEANNMILKGVLKSGDHLITSTYEHPAITEVIPYLKENGIEVSLIAPNNGGLIEPGQVLRNIKKNTRLISIMFVNNELGVINPIEDIASIANNNSILIHSDAVQAFGKIPINLDQIPLDFISISSHKLYGPKGAGALFKRQGTKIAPMIYGGGQESNLRASTENFIGIAGFGLASEIAFSNLKINSKKISSLENLFTSELDKQKINYKINGIKRIPGVFNITFNKLDGQQLVLNLDMCGIGISFGAACASGTTKVPEFLIKLGLTKKEALSSVRISFGKIHSEKDVITVAKEIGKIINKNEEK
tara:strand:+ start:701 stop:1825 length:1125 start_codon:yes stop_codon:yes gene_type:complete